MSDRRKQILERLAHGEIGVADAERFLDAPNNGKSAVTARSTPEIKGPRSYYPPYPEIPWTDGNRER